MRAKDRRLLIVAVLGLAVLLMACVTIVPAWIVDWRTAAEGSAQLPAADLLRAENDIRSTLLQGLGGLLALTSVAFGAAVTLRQVGVSREGHTIELFTQAIDQLSSDQVSVRHGGIYALELLAELDQRYRGHIHALLTAFVRQHAPWPPTRPQGEVDAERARFHGGLADDVGAAMGALSRRSMVEEGAWSELEKADLRGAVLMGCDLRRCCFIGSNLEGADLAGANLRQSTLSGAILRNANLSGTDLTDAKLDGTELTGVITNSATKWPVGFRPPERRGND